MPTSKRATLRAFGGAALCAILACGGGATGEVSSALRRGELDLALRLYEAQGGRHHASLAAIAGATLEREAASDDGSRSMPAFAALRQMGTAARPVLQRLAASGARAPVRARALAQLAELGDEDAREQLRDARTSADPQVAAAAVGALDPESEAAQLRALLDSPAAAVRMAAIQRLVRAPRDPETVRVLARSAQHDPELAVRASALTALSRQGEPGVRAIEARLEDPDAELRAAAGTALVSADLARARSKLGPWLAGEVTPEGIDAARALLASAPGDAAQAARGVLARGIAHTDAKLRGRAACSLLTLRDAQLSAAAAARAASEPVRSVRLCLALSLPAGNAARTKLLHALTDASDVPAAQAAGELARAGDAGALRRLRALLAHADTSVRSVAVRALGRDLGRTHDVRGALRDPDAGVRIAAASAILTPRAGPRGQG